MNIQWSAEEKEALNKEGFILSSDTKAVKKTTGNSVVTMLRHTAPKSAKTYATIIKLSDSYECQTEEVSGCSAFDYEYHNQEESFNSFQEAMNYFN